jgi:hypothetical protein
MQSFKKQNNNFNASAQSNRNSKIEYIEIYMCVFFVYKTFPSAKKKKRLDVSL